MDAHADNEVWLLKASDLEGVGWGDRNKTVGEIEKSVYKID